VGAGGFSDGPPGGGGVGRAGDDGGDDGCGGGAGEESDAGVEGEECALWSFEACLGEDADASALLEVFDGLFEPVGSWVVAVDEDDVAELPEPFELWEAHVGGHDPSDLEAWARGLDEDGVDAGGVVGGDDERRAGVEGAGAAGGEVLLAGCGEAVEGGGVGLEESDGGGGGEVWMGEGGRVAWGDGGDPPGEDGDAGGDGGDGGERGGVGHCPGLCRVRGWRARGCVGVDCGRIDGRLWVWAAMRGLR